MSLSVDSIYSKATKMHYFYKYSKLQIVEIAQTLHRACNTFELQIQYIGCGQTYHTLTQ